jgi:hypothetical protein
MRQNMTKLAIIITALCLLEALCFFWTGWWAVGMFRAAGASMGQIYQAAEGEWLSGIMYLAAGLLYLGAPKARPPLAVAGVLVGISGLYFVSRSINLLLGSWNFSHGNIVAVSNWVDAIMVALGLFCAIDLTVLLRRRSASR